MNKNIFKTKYFALGTRNLAGQIAQKVELYQEIYFDNQIFKNCKQEIKEFVNNLVNHSNVSNSSPKKHS